MSNANKIAIPKGPRRATSPFKVSDRVTANGRNGTIVGDIASGEYSPKLRSGAWNTLVAGVLVQWDDDTLTHVREPETSLRILEREPDASLTRVPAEEHIGKP